MTCLLFKPLLVTLDAEQFVCFDWLFETVINVGSIIISTPKLVPLEPLPIQAVLTSTQIYYRVLTMISLKLKSLENIREVFILAHNICGTRV